MKLRHAMIFVQDITEAKNFYHDILGIPIQQDLSEELGMLIMDVGGVIMTIHGGYKTSHDEVEHARTSITFEVEDIEKTQQELQLKGVPIVGEIQESPVHKYLMLRDPSGNILEVGQYAK